MSVIATEKAGATMYKELLRHYQSMREGAQRDMNHHACAFAESNKSEDRALFQSAKARVGAWDEAIRYLTKDGGDWLRLDFPKP
jgi:hypothetical protein